MLNALLGLLLLAYPIFVYFGLQHFEPRILVLILLVTVGVRFLMNRGKTQLNNLPIVIVISVYVALVLLLNKTILLLAYPIIMNLSFLVLFAYSLYRPPCIIERFARLTEPKLSTSAIYYTQRVTKAWIVFFIVNGLVSMWTALYASMEVWTLYNGLISYVLMGLMFLIEYCIRWCVKAKNQDEHVIADD